MPTPILPIPATVEQEVRALLQQALAKLAPYQVTLTKEERKSLSATAMGRESIPFAQQAGQLLTNFPQVLSRTVTDDMISQYPDWMQAFEAADNILLETQTISALVSGNRLTAGNAIMRVARTSYKNGQDDNGKTPGVREHIERMSARFPGNDQDDDTPPPKQ